MVPAGAGDAEDSLCGVGGPAVEAARGDLDPREGSC